MAVSDINSAVASYVTTHVTKSTFVNAIGWFILALIVIGASAWGAWVYFERKKFNKIVIAHTIIHGFFQPTYRDVAKSVKLGKGGFEVIYLKKMKTWKLAHGARTGINEYTFYVMPDGYWYPGQVSADLKTIDKNGGLINVVTTNPTMRAQYTALEKQIDALHGEKQGFWDKYGQLIFNIGYVAVIGIFCWLSFREIASFLGQGTNLANSMNELAKNMNTIAVNLNGACNSGGLVKG